MNICYVPSDMDAPGCYRCLFPARQLRKLGHSVTMPPYIEHMQENGYPLVEFQIDLRSSPKPMADLYVLQQRKERLWAQEGIGQLRRWGVATICDIDDNYEELPTWNPAWLGSHPYRRNDGTILNRRMRRGKEPYFNERGRLVQQLRPLAKGTNQANRWHMNDAFKQADALTCSTPYLAELYGHLNSDVTVVRNLLDWDIWDDVQPQYEVERERLRIGYLGVFKYRQGDLAILRGVVPKILKRHPEVEFVANSDAVHDFLSVPEEQRVVVPEYGFRPSEGPYPVGEKTAVLDIGLVPMIAGGLNEGKSHLKGMEYNAAGIPFVASPRESYRDYWCEEGKNGFLAEGEKQWEEHLEFLIKCDAMRREMGRYSRAKAHDHTFQRRISEWESVYQRLLGDSYRGIARQSLSVGAVQKTAEFGYMLRAIANKEPRTVVEIGTARGGAFWALCQVARPDATLVSIDLVGGSPIDIRNGKDVYGGRLPRGRIAAYAGAGQTAHMIDLSSQLPSTVEVLRHKLEGRDIDVLFIDGDHRYEGVRRDYTLYEPLVAPGGLIFFHDITVQNDPRSGVHILWPELKEKYRVWEEFITDDDWGLGHWGGIGMLVKDG